jgi:hypothetical protein
MYDMGGLKCLVKINGDGLWWMRYTHLGIIEVYCAFETAILGSVKCG